MQVGKSMVFMRQGVEKTLDRERGKAVSSSARMVRMVV